MDLTNHAVDVSLTDVVAGPSRVGIKTQGCWSASERILASFCDARSAVVCFVMAHASNMAQRRQRGCTPSACVDHDGATAAVLVNKDASWLHWGCRRMTCVPRLRNLVTSASFST